VSLHDARGSDAHSLPDPVDLMVRNGTVVSAGSAVRADVLIGNGRVRALTEPGTPLPGQPREIDATGRLVLPGGVDPHCHVGFTSGAFTTLDDYRQATQAAVCGGTTTIVDFAIPRPGEVPIEVAIAQQAKASQGLELLSRPVDQDRLCRFGLGFLAGSFNEFAVGEGGPGADQGDEVGGVDSAPAVLG
jgi:dihydroorotase-like cyclic amidohydrolase